MNLVIERSSVGMLYLLLILVYVAFKAYQFFQSRSMPSYKGPFFTIDPPLTAEESNTIGLVVNSLTDHQDRFDFDPNMDGHSNRKVAYKQTASAASDFFAKGIRFSDGSYLPGHLTARDLVQANSKKIFLLHRILGRYHFDNGLLIRLTVNSNLFGGSIANIGTEKQIRWLQGNRSPCFSANSAQRFSTKENWGAFC